jgi:hypothetical protein
MNADDLWLKDQPDDLVDLPTAQIERAEADASRHIGCPLSWFRLVFPVVRGKSELAVALCLYRLRAVQRSRTVTVSNVGLLAELGIDRFAKYRALFAASRKPASSSSSAAVSPHSRLSSPTDLSDRNDELSRVHACT